MTQDTLTETEVELTATQDVLTETQAALETANTEIDSLVVSPDSDNYKIVYKAGKMDGEGLPCDITRTRVKVNFSNYGMYAKPVLLEILNTDEEPIYSNLVLAGQLRYIVDVSEPVVPGEDYWLRKTYYDGDMNVISTMMVRVNMFIGLD